MPFKVFFELYIWMKENTDFNISIVAEGKSVEQWKKVDVPLFTEEDLTQEQIYAFMAAIKPDCVITGLSSPNNLEDSIGLIANTTHTKLGVVSDTWGAISRVNKARPDFILTMDAFDAGLCAAKFPDAHISVIGDITRKITAPEDVSRVCDKIQSTGKNLILIAGQNPDYTDDVVQIIRDSVAMEPQNCAVVVRPHPKFSGLPVEKPILDLIETFPPGTVVNIDGSTDDIASCASIVVGVFTTTLRVASMANRTAVSVITPKTIAGMKKSTGLSQYPLAMMGNCLEISQPTLLSKIPRHEGYRSKEFNPAVVLQMFK